MKNFLILKIIIIFQISSNIFAMEGLKDEFFGTKVYLDNVEYTLGKLIASGGLGGIYEIDKLIQGKVWIVKRMFKKEIIMEKPTVLAKIKKFFGGKVKELKEINEHIYRELLGHLLLKKYGVNTTDVKLDDSGEYLFKEFIPGQDLSRLMYDNTLYTDPLTLKAFKEIIRQILKLPVGIRDLRKENIRYSKVNEKFYVLDMELKKKNYTANELLKYIENPSKVPSSMFQRRSATKQFWIDIIDQGHCVQEQCAQYLEKTYELCLEMKSICPSKEHHLDVRTRSIRKTVEYRKRMNFKD